MRKFRIFPYDEVNNVWLLKEHVWWIFYSFISSGKKEKLTEWVKENKGILI